jgi:hypothetical protein
MIGFIIGSVIIRRRSRGKLATSQRLDEHPPSLNRSQSGHKIHTSQKKTLRNHSGVEAEEGPHPLLSRDEEGFGLLNLFG